MDIKVMMTIGLYSMAFPFLLPLIYCLIHRKTIRQKGLFVFAGIGISFLVFKGAPLLLIYCLGFLTARFSLSIGELWAESPFEILMIIYAGVGTLSCVIAMWILKLVLKKTLNQRLHSIAGSARSE